MTGQALRYAIIGLFLFVLVAPELDATLHFNLVPPVPSSRSINPAPIGNPLTGLWQSNGYFGDYEKHYNDVFGLRDFFIRLKNQLQYSLFHDADEVVVGRNNWFVDRGSVYLEQRAADTLTPEQWTRLRERLAHLNAILTQKGIYLLVVPVPFKNTVYPEDFPAFAAARPTLTGEEHFRRILIDDHIPYIDVYRVLSERKHTVNVYYRTDIHWNPEGAQAVARAIVDALSRKVNPQVRWRYANSYDMRPFENGGESNSMALLWPIRDIEPILTAGAGSCGTFRIYARYAGFVNACGGPLLPTTTMFGNSYMMSLEQTGLQEYFSRFYRVLDYSYFGKIFEMIRPGTKVVIWQIFELELAYQLQEDSYWYDVDHFQQHDTPPNALLESSRHRLARH